MKDYRDDLIRRMSDQLALYHEGCDDPECGVGLLVVESRAYLNAQAGVRQGPLSLPTVRGDGTVAHKGVSRLTDAQIRRLKRDATYGKAPP